MPNGIAASGDGKYVYVVSTRDRNIVVYSRNIDNTLSQVQLYEVMQILYYKKNPTFWMGKALTCHLG